MSPREDLDLWLEPVDTLPQDLYAIVRDNDLKVKSKLEGPCPLDEAFRIGSVKAGSGPVVVDLYQKVGSVTLTSAELGVIQEARISWLEFTSAQLEVKVRVVVAAPPAIASNDASSGEAGSVAPPEAPPPGSFGEASPGGGESPLGPSPLGVESVDANFNGVDDDWSRASSLAMSRLQEPIDTELERRRIAEERGQVPERQLGERTMRSMYKPIALNNCDMIIPNLYLGGITAAMDTERLIEQGFRAVCCCCRELEFPTTNFNKELDYYRVDVEDIGREPIELFFPEAADFIHSWVAREQPVLVHCRAGVSRSASVVLAYLVTKQGYSLHDAFFLVRSHRAVITPNLTFMEKLGDYEVGIYPSLGEPTIEINKYQSWYDSPDRAAVPDLKPD